MMDSVRLAAWNFGNEHVRYAISNDRAPQAASKKAWLRELSGDAG